MSTISISAVREHTEKVKPPRALWVPFPFGYALGRQLLHRVRDRLDASEDKAWKAAAFGVAR